MKRILVALFSSLLLLATPPAAVAQAPLPTCLHGISGAPAPFMPRWESGDVGYHIYWWCVRADGITVTEGFSCAHVNGCDPVTFSTKIQEITVAPDKIAAAKAAWSATMAFPCDAVTRLEVSANGDLCRERQSIYATNRASWLAGLVQTVPPPVVPPLPVVTYAVAKNGVAVDRPSFAVVNGVRSFSSKTRVAIGAPCGDLFLMEGSTRYGQVSAVPLLVAVCTKTP